MSAQKTLVTAELLPGLSSRLSSEGKRTELVEGELVVIAPGGGRHGRIAHRAAVFITNHVLNRDLGEVFAAGTGFLLRRDPDTVRAPDVAFVSSERLGTSEAPAGFVERAPDLAVEVVSPCDSAAAVQSKVEDWLGADTRSATVYRSLHEVEVLSEPDSLDGAPVLTDFAVPVGDLLG